MNSAITRRDFVSGAVAAAAAPLLPRVAHAQGLTDQWSGFGGVGDYALANGNNFAAVNAAHGVRDGAYAAKAIEDTGETYDVVVVGGGVAGLGAAYTVHRNHSGAKRCLVLENHAMFGGESRGNQIDVDGVRVTGPQGANQTETMPEGEARTFQREIGLPEQFEFAEPRGLSQPMKFGDDHYDPMFGRQKLVTTGYFLGSRDGWNRDPNWEDAFAALPWPAHKKRTLGEWFNYSRSHNVPAGDGATGDPRLTPPGGDPTENTALARWLDTMSYSDFIRDFMKLDAAVVAQHMDQYVGLTLGGTVDTISAYAARLVNMPGVSSAPWRSNPRNISYCLPMGNAIYPRLMVRAMLPDAYPDKSLTNMCFGTTRLDALDRPEKATRVRLGATVIAVEHEGDPASARSVAAVYERGGRLYRVRAKGVVMACGTWIARRIVKGMPDDLTAAFHSIHHSPVLVANVAVRHWRYFDRLGITAARWFDGFGFTTCIRRPVSVDGAGKSFSPDEPAMLTFYTTLMRSGSSVLPQSVGARQQLFDTPFAVYEQQIRRQLQDMFGSHGFDAQRDIAGIVLNRWGHAFAIPEPGFYMDKPGKPAPRTLVRNGFGRITFGCAELMGHQSWLGALNEARRALSQLG